MEDDYERPTSSYQMGTLAIYKSPKRPKMKAPVYGYKFVTTDGTMIARVNGRWKTLGKPMKGKKRS